MSDIKKIREALSFGVRTGDLELMQAVYQLESSGPEIKEDHGLNVVQRNCSRCRLDFLVSSRHVNRIPVESLFNICGPCLDQIAATPKYALLSSADEEMAQRMMKECRGDVPDPPNESK